jgi:hypothetical protein
VFSPIPFSFSPSLLPEPDSSQCDSCICNEYCACLEYGRDSGIISKIHFLFYVKGVGMLGWIQNKSLYKGMLREIFLFSEYICIRLLPYFYDRSRSKLWSPSPFSYIRLR